jgi:hypothetical protein
VTEGLMSSLNIPIRQRANTPRSIHSETSWNPKIAFLAGYSTDFLLWPVRPNR